ncbi:SidA/IucD/PvdA family monooxygenase [Bradyrhizobium sp. U87765 SZCCT0131]|uniref:lysine N(6)-hydroxylase/L-ornithine N(5)-oxygenase family protein n=1 Tax=unclassified Bradyrhizobium TaxID=2631580 RepID=UPI001BA499F5|nr:MULTISPECIES: SidA/IucD/PvdA family monooxygenase [unclassified Bradyrhizobium]MBR1217849.1 SidA/IucD/PvdA family monooxygenase [Bradyrhizobium sp. U87765 SZCCT0131]MBR1261205.1 SidA/IucD/PvdA family monooxygenase [Bradyrhizobium sp. U87765 SZCCT0134]MBR1303347.1 SidA/IucD/PvdA family monooxygenase [Bradyrhizobium sp. U87765 SZCCT0110]MBR1318953.1 SidA/IucD/PvdA family monooxygenase [Bradyrhizobium sp. U87765 SZCCT0109]MBR1347278.1 SidA/IucD/PvdA family monooxygenase [Bradyrhizobium sp. U87
MRYRCVGIGVGPSNLSVASLLHDREGISNVFFDRKPKFSWHDGMQFPEANLQVAIFKDLVTLADPTNSFSFISYLHSQGRIYHFLNARFESVPRREFSNYMRWACERNGNIRFAEDVKSITFDGTFIVETSRQRVIADNICVGVGICPRVPPFVRLHPDSTSFHVADFLPNAYRFRGKRVVVVGGGQSGAEAVLALLTGGPGGLPHQVSWISSRDNFLPLDDSPFTNDYFTPSHSSYFFEQTERSKTAFVERNLLASDGISDRTLRQIYQRIYTLRFIDVGPPSVGLLPGRRVVQCAYDSVGWNLLLEHAASGATEVLRADVVVWATGFRPAAMEFLAPLLPRIERQQDEILIDDDFAAIWDGPADRNIFVLNAARRQRGLPDPNLSLTAWRSQRVVDRICGGGHVGEIQQPSFISWAQSIEQCERQPLERFA